MRVVRTIFVALLFLLAVAFATANSSPVEISLPNAPFDLWPAYPPVEVPLFAVMLAGLVGGVLIGGFGSLFEQVRLRATARRARKLQERADSARQAAEEECERLTHELQRLRAERSVAVADALRETDDDVIVAEIDTDEDR